MTPLRASGPFRVLTAKDAKALGVLRHSGAHILATAVRRLRPDAKIGFGPAIDDGFYYDFEVEKPFTPEDLAAFEEEMRKVVAEKFPFVREEVDRGEAKKRFADDPLKLERIERPRADEVISTYTDGPFIDLCRGPHVPDTSYLKHFKLLHDGRRVLARRRAAPDAAAHLRDGVVRRKTSTRTCTASRKQSAATIASSARRSTSSCSTRSRRAPRSGRRKARSCSTSSSRFMRERQQEHFIEVKTPLLFNAGAVGDVGPLGEVPREHVPRARTTRRANRTCRSSR